MEKIGLQGIFDDANFQAGLARYLQGLGRADAATQKTAQSMTGVGHAISTAIGTALGNLATQVLPRIQSTLSGPLDAVRAWGGQLDTLSDIFGLTDENATTLAVAMNRMGMTVDDGAAGFSYFTRQVSNTKEQFTNAAETFASATGEIAAAHADAVNKIARDWREAQAEAASNIASIWSDLAERRVDIESNLADNIQSIQQNLQERLSDLAEQRQELQKDTAKSLAKLESDTRDRLRSAHSARERRQVRKDAAERKKEILEQAAERERQIAKQEAREKKQADKQIALAEKVAQKQIEAAEKAANKQVEAITKAMAKQQRAVDEQIAEADKAAAKQFAAAKKALSDVKEKSPLSRALRDLGLNFNAITDESRPFTDRLADIMDAFAKLPEGVNTTAIALELFGKGGLEWIDFLRQGRKGLEEARKMGIDLGLVLDPEQVKAYNRQLRYLDMGFNAIAINIGRELLPYATDLVMTFNKLFREAMPGIVAFIKRMSEAFKAGGLEGLGKEFWKALTEPKGLLEQLGAIVQRIRDWFTAGDGQKILQGAGNAFNAVITGFRDWVNSDDGQKVIRLLTIDTTTAIGEGLALAIKIAKWIGDVMTQLARRLDDWVNSPEGGRQLAAIARDIFNAIVRGLKDDFSNRDWGATVMGMLSSTLRFGVAGQISGLANLGTSIGTAILNALTAAITSRDIAGDLANWLRTNLKNALISMGSPWSNLAGMIFGGTTPTPTPTNTNPNSVPYTGQEYQIGGPVRRTGMALVHVGEYVLNAQQARAWAPMLAGASYNSTYNFYHTWPAAVPPSQREWTENMVRQVTQQEVRGILRRG